ncbi:MAG: isoprenyl transferase [Vicinamibacteria bacterium]|nr:isoprenyl transferase [Vicinamibacteria bacterium]
MSREDLLAVMPQDSVEEKQLLDGIDFTRLPRHVAIIMDGNGRWAKKRYMPRVEGHRAGIASVRETVETSARLGLQVLTLYAFSVENWKRPELEISALMMLLKHYLRAELDTMLTNDIRFGVIGRPEALPTDVQDELARATERTRNSKGLLFQLALNYGGRTELADGVRRLAADVQANGLDPATIDEATIARYLYTAGQPDPDLLIRTSGELRVSNFLLWQIAYSEIWVTDVLWPDFRRRHLLQAVVDYQRRERRYGGIVSS